MIYDVANGRTDDYRRPQSVLYTSPSIHFPFLGYCVVLRADEQLDRPDDQGPENIHPTPPYLG